MAKTIQLNSNNHVLIRGEINHHSIGSSLQQLGTTIAGEKEVFIIIASPGGHVTVGNLFIEQIRYLQSQNVTVNCVAIQAASMAFAIFQTCDNRYITSTSILMQHQMSTKGLDGPFENIMSYIDFMEQLNGLLSDFQSDRLGLTSDEFKKETQHDLWLLGNNAIKFNAADQIVTIGCTPDLYKRRKQETLDTIFFGKVTLTYSGCPLIIEPLTIESDNKNLTEKNIETIKDDVYKLNLNNIKYQKK